MTLKFEQFRALNETGGGKSAGLYEFLEMNVVEAKKIAKAMLSNARMDFDEVYPNFEHNFMKIKHLLSKATGAKRKDMPVVSSYQVEQFKQDLKEHGVESHYAWQELGDLKPIQSQIYFDRVVNAEIEFGGIHHGSDQTKKTMIVSKEGYIIDGHHRWATGTLADETVKMKTLVVNMDIDHLLEYTKDWGDRMGNLRNEQVLQSDTNRL